jgi:fibronectin type 3 domain-containing protein
LLLRRIRGIELHLDPVDKTIDVPPPEEPGRVDAKIPIAGLVGQTITITERTRGGKGHYSEWSNTVTLDVEAPLPPPTEVVAKAVSAGVEVNWRANGATSFHIFRSDENTKIPQQAGTSDSTTYTDKTTEYDKHYQYFVQALRGKTESEVSAPVDITPVDVFPPAVPAGITATTGIAAIELAWERNTEPDFAKYIIWRAAGDGPFQKLAETDSPVYSDKAVKSGTRYRYSISAVDQKGNESQRSAPVEATSP